MSPSYPEIRNGLVGAPSQVCLSRSCAGRSVEGASPLLAVCPPFTCLCPYVWLMVISYCVFRRTAESVRAACQTFFWAWMLKDTSVYGNCGLQNRRKCLSLPTSSYALPRDNRGTYTRDHGGDGEKVQVSGQPPSPSQDHPSQWKRNCE